MVQSSKTDQDREGAVRRRGYCEQYFPGFNSAGSPFFFFHYLFSSISTDNLELLLRKVLISSFYANWLSHKLQPGSGMLCLFPSWESYVLPRLEGWLHTLWSETLPGFAGDLHHSAWCVWNVRKSSFFPGTTLQDPKLLSKGHEQLVTTVFRRLAMFRAVPNFPNPQFSWR